MSGDVLAHGIGGRQDLPIPFQHALGGAVVALLATFFVLTRAWPQSRFRGNEAGRPVPVGLAKMLDSPVTRFALRTAGVAMACWLVAVLVFGPSLGRDNAAPGMLYVWLWVCVPVLSALFGPIWRLVSPLRAIHAGLTRLSGQPATEGVRSLPARWGYWPAAIGLFAFVWLELVAPDRASLATVRLAFAVYAMATLLGALLFGSGWFGRGDPFEVYSSLAARLAPIGRRDDGVLVWRNPFNGLDGTAVRPGLAAVVLVLLGSTAFDSLSNAPQWVSLTQGSGAKVWWDTAGLAACILLIGGLYSGATRLTAGFTGDRQQLPGLFAQSILPIALGYIVAHYYSLAIVEGQRTFFLAWHWSQNAGLVRVDTSLVQPALVATLQVVVVVVGHVAGAVAAHDRATQRKSFLNIRSWPVSCLCSCSWSSTPMQGCRCCSPHDARVEDTRAQRLRRAAAG